MSIIDLDALKPWQHRSWISIRDPDFEAKAARVLDLYAGRWKGRRLSPNDYVICADASPNTIKTKPTISRRRKHPRRTYRR